VTLRDRRVRESIDSTPRSVELALTVQAQKILAGNTDCLDVAGPHDSMQAYVLHRHLDWLRSDHGINLPLFNHL
jgi:hypothetical protein